MYRRFISFLPWVGLLMVLVLVGCGKEVVKPSVLRKAEFNCLGGVVTVHTMGNDFVLLDGEGKNLKCEGDWT